MLWVFRSVDVVVSLGLIWRNKSKLLFVDGSKLKIKNNPKKKKKSPKLQNLVRGVYNVSLSLIMHGQFTSKQGLNKRSVRFRDVSYQNDL